MTTAQTQELVQTDDLKGNEQATQGIEIKHTGVKVKMANPEETVTEEAVATTEEAVASDSAAIGSAPVTTEEAVVVDTPHEVTEEEAKQIVDKVKLIGRELGMSLYEREDEIKSLLLGLMTGKHILLLGDPGTGKSALAELLAEHITDSNYFQWLLNKTSDPSELLGPVSIKAMENDQFLRKPDGKLPEAHISFIDECYKSNSATLNTLLPIMNERVWYNDGKQLPVNLKLMIGASNEFPENEEGLGAFHDRFIFRHWTEYIGDAQNQFNMLARSVELRSGAVVPSNTTISLTDIENVQEFVNKVEVTKPTLNAFQKLIHELKNKRSINISDRRLVACVHIIQAAALLDGRTKTEPDDMEHLAFVLWEKKEDIEDIQSIIMKMMNPFKDKVNTSYKEAALIRDETLAMTDKTQRANKAIDARNVLDKLADRIKQTIAKAEKEGISSVEDMKNKHQEVVAMTQEIVSKCLFSVEDVMGSDSDSLPF